MNEVTDPTNPTVKSLIQDLKNGFSKTHRQCFNARFVVCELPLNLSEVKKILPFGIKPIEPAMGTFFHVNYTQPTFTFPYFEAALLIHVKTLFGTGVHCCWIVVNDDTPIIYGRETLAYPKKLANLTFEESDTAITATVDRRGINVVSLIAKKEEPITDPGPIFGFKTFNAGGIGQMLGINPIWCFKIHEEIKEAYNIELNLAFEESKFDPLTNLVEGEPINPRMVVEDIMGSEYLFPAGVAGPKWYANTYLMRVR